MNTHFEWSETALFTPSLEEAPKQPSSEEAPKQPSVVHPTKILDPDGDLKIAVGADHSTDEHTFRVCSATMRRASPVWKAMLFGPWVEAKPKNGDPWSVKLPDDDPEALGVLLAIVHGQNQHELFPKFMTLELLYDILIVSDKYVFFFSCEDEDGKLVYDLSMQINDTSLMHSKLYGSPQDPDAFVRPDCHFGAPGLGGMLPNALSAVNSRVHKAKMGAKPRIYAEESERCFSKVIDFLYKSGLDRSSETGCQLQVEDNGNYDEDENDVDVFELCDNQVLGCILRSFYVSARQLPHLYVTNNPQWTIEVLLSIITEALNDVKPFPGHSYESLPHDGFQKLLDPIQFESDTTYDSEDEGSGTENHWGEYRWKEDRYSSKDYAEQLSKNRIFWDVCYSGIFESEDDEYYEYLSDDDAIYDSDSAATEGSRD
ncbi:hypothetical protein QBC35DRAFT_468892 [Podospora australis]|uniref:BTB domain-containing protein n=1 Tax=Podospora australis TaxID=1536484 RepID=A0AAN6X3K3_9PEZI|nr:hypothetical protein QBC35DRAFT_468892 [Podospora australis]